MPIVSLYWCIFGRFLYTDDPDPCPFMLLVFILNKSNDKSMASTRWTLHNWFAMCLNTTIGIQEAPCSSD